MSGGQTSKKCKKPELSFNTGSVLLVQENQIHFHISFLSLLICIWGNRLSLIWYSTSALHLIPLSKSASLQPWYPPEPPCPSNQLPSGACLHLMLSVGRLWFLTSVPPQHWIYLRDRDTHTDIQTGDRLWWVKITHMWKKVKRQQAVLMHCSFMKSNAPECVYNIHIREGYNHIINALTRVKKEVVWRSKVCVRNKVGVLDGSNKHKTFPGRAVFMYLLYRKVRQHNSCLEEAE